MPVKKEVNEKSRRKVSTRFAGVLAIISITGFVEIILTRFFNISISEYSAFLWLMIMGIGFILVSRPKSLYISSQRRFDEGSFSRLTTLVLGAIAIVAAILSLPFIDVNHPILSASMGIISIIAIIFIIVQTWIIKE